MAKLFRIVVDEVPARELKVANLAQHRFSIHRLEIFLLRPIGSKRVGHLPFNYGHSSVSQADLITRIDDGSSADRRSVAETRIKRYIGTGPNGGIVEARRVQSQSVETNGGVVGACGVEMECIGPVAGIVVAFITLESLDTGGGIGVSRVATKRKVTGGGVEPPGVVSERIDSVGGVVVPVVLLMRVSKPTAVLCVPVVLLNSA
jgi:hypothetical protein